MPCPRTSLCPLLGPSLCPAAALCLTGGAVPKPLSNRDRKSCESLSASGVARGERDWPLNEGQLPDFRVARAPNRVDGNRRASRNGRASDLPPERRRSVSMRDISRRCTSVRCCGRTFRVAVRRCGAAGGHFASLYVGAVLREALTRGSLRCVQAPGRSLPGPSPLHWACAHSQAGVLALLVSSTLGPDVTEVRPRLQKSRNRNG